MRDLTHFFEVARSIRMTMPERALGRGKVLGGAMEPESQMRFEEKLGIRAGLRVFTAQNPLSYAREQDHERPIAVWLGSGLFRGLKPFIV